MNGGTPRAGISLRLRGALTRWRGHRRRVAHGVPAAPRGPSYPGPMHTEREHSAPAGRPAWTARRDALKIATARAVVLR